MQVLGRRVVRVGDERGRVLVLRRPVETFDEALDPLAAVPPHDPRGNLVTYYVAEDSWMAGACTNRVPDPEFDRSRPPRFVEEGEVLLPGDADEDPQSMGSGEMEDPRRGHYVGAHRVDSVRRHRSEVGCDDLGAGEEVARYPAKRSVSASAAIELLVAGTQALPAR